MSIEKLLLLLELIRSNEVTSITVTKNTVTIRIKK